MHAVTTGRAVAAHIKVYKMSMVNQRIKAMKLPAIEMKKLFAAIKQKALQESIETYEKKHALFVEAVELLPGYPHRIINKDGTTQKVHFGMADCPLCRAYHACLGCPVKAKTGRPSCVETPYAIYENMLYGAHTLESMIDFTKKELDFLRSLLPRNNNDL